MATIYPFQPYRYTAKAGALDDLVTQPYDKISPAMQQRYLALNERNLVRVILGPKSESDSETDNVYTRAAAYLEKWIAEGALAKDDAPAVYPYFQEFTEPDTGERLVRKGFIALGKVEEYEARIVHRHEQTLSGPKKDRRKVLEHTHAHFGQIFMLYPDKTGAIDAILDAAAKSEPVARVVDEYGVVHTLWRITDTAQIVALMSDKKLVIADGHHRYETALGYHHDNPTMPGADRVMMTFVNMYSPGLRILATHRLVSGLDAAQLSEKFLLKAGVDFDVDEIASVDALKSEWTKDGGPVVIGAAIGTKLYRLRAKTGTNELDVRVLHERLIGKALGIDEAAVRDEKHIRYVRGIEPAIEAARSGAAQIAFLLKPTSIDQVADTSFGGGVMPQKSTDFYPKVLTGLAIYKLD